MYETYNFRTPYQLSVRKSTKALSFMNENEWVHSYTEYT